MAIRQGRCLAEAGHIGSQIKYPHGLGVAGIFLAACKEEHVGFDPLGIENTGGESQNGVKIAFVHQVLADILAHVTFKKDIVGQYYRRAPARFQCAVDMLQEGELFVAGRIGKIVS